MNKKTISTRRLVLTALLAALTTAGSSLRIVMPLTIAGNASFHLGNILCALSGLLVGPWLGGLAAGLGSAIYDCLNPVFIMDVLITFVTKAAYGVAAGLVIRIGDRENWGYFKAVLASLAGAVSYAVLYLLKTYFYSGLFMRGLTPEAAWVTVLGKLPATIFNGTVAVIFAPILGIAIRNAIRKAHLNFE